MYFFGLFYVKFDIVSEKRKPSNVITSCGDTVVWLIIYKSHFVNVRKKNCAQYDSGNRFQFFYMLNRTVTGLKKLKNETRSEIVIELVGPVCGAIILLVKFSHSTSC